jgi:uncharacterized membrane protein YsdA (DUF1294 family)
VGKELAAVAATWIVVVNVWTFLRFGDDKRRAVRGLRRIPEASLLQLALLGGTIGAYAGRRHFRHKTRKEPFVTFLHVIAFVQVGALAGYLLAGPA